MILSDNEIRKANKEGRIIISSFNEVNLGTNSYDVHLGDKLFVSVNRLLDSAYENKFSKICPVKMCTDGTGEMLLWEESDDYRLGWRLEPNKLYLACTEEYTETYGYVPCIEGKSSVGRLGINIHATAGFGDEGFMGHWTLEISCVQPVIIYPGMPIGQIYYMAIQGEVGTSYKDKENANYINDNDIPQTSRLWKHNFFRKRVD